jgi:hypothetical protein
MKLIDNILKFLNITGINCQVDGIFDLIGLGGKALSLCYKSKPLGSEDDIKVGEALKDASQPLSSGDFDRIDGFSLLVCEGFIS